MGSTNTLVKLRAIIGAVTMWRVHSADSSLRFSLYNIMHNTALNIEGNEIAVYARR